MFHRFIISRDQGPPTGRGFILVITLSLVALLVLSVVGVVAAVRLGLQLGETTGSRVVARQNALVALGVALGELQRHAGPAGADTGMAGVAGVSAGTGGAGLRHWAGVWSAAGSPPVWLASASDRSVPPRLAPGAAPVLLVGAGTVGAEATNSEHVVAGRVVVPLAAGNDEGGMAWWVGDEGVKISAVSPAHSHADAARLPVPPAPASSNALRDALAANAGQAGRAITYEQLRCITSPAAPLALGTIRDCFHSVTLTAAEPAAPALRTGRINLNTTNALVWRAILEAYSTVTATTPLSRAQINTAATRIQNGFAAANAARPFRDVSEFAASDLLANALRGFGVTPAEFMSAAGGVLVTRSHTFRIRAYGDAARGGSVVARAACEAIVQQTNTPAPGSLGLRYEVTYFRWLGPDDI